MRRRSIILGTLTLTGAALVSRGIGLFYRVLLARYLGPEGLGFYQMIFPFYITAVTVCLAGTPVALSQMVAEGHVPPRRLLQIAGGIVGIITLGVAVIVVSFTRPLAVLFYHDVHFVPLLRILGPALFIVAGSGILRGYFVGQQQMTVPATAQVAEQLSRLLMLWLVVESGPTLLLGPHDPAVAVWLIPFGEAVGLLVLVYCYWHQDRTVNQSPKRPVSMRLWVPRVLGQSTPVAFSRLATSVIGMVEAGMIPLRLEHAGMTGAQAIAFFGTITGIAMPLILFPTALTLSLATNLVPAFAESQARKDHDRMAGLFNQAMTATALLSFPVTVLLLLDGPHLATVLFHAAVPRRILWPLALGGLFLYFDITVSGVLRGLGHTAIPMRHDILASLIELGIIWEFGGRPYGTEAVAWAIAIGFVIATVLDFGAVLRLVPSVRLHFRWYGTLVRPAVAAVPLFFLLPWWQQSRVPDPWSTVSGLGLGVVIYLTSLRLTGHSFSVLT